MLLRVLLLVFLASYPASTRADDQLPLIGHFRNTHYYLVPESGYANRPKDTDVLTMKGHLIATVSRAFKNAMDIEGTGRLLDGRVINFAGVKDSTIRYRVTKSPYGNGVGQCELSPFHTIAADPAKIPLGTTVRIDETVGMVLPDGTAHDGIWHVDDIGGAIKGDRIDLFLGDGDQGAVLRRAGIGHLQPLTVRLVAPPSADSCVYRDVEEN